jgi:hypothetical protein
MDSSQVRDYATFIDRLLHPYSGCVAQATLLGARKGCLYGSQHIEQLGTAKG